MLAVAAVGVLCTLLLLAATLRATGAARLSWGATAVLGVVWTVDQVGLWLGWPDVLTWGVLRVVGWAVALTGIVVAPGVQRTLRSWGVLLLDGWLVGASALAVAWVPLISGSATVAMLQPLVWMFADLVTTVALAGLARRNRVLGQRSVRLLLLASALTVCSDLAWAVTSDRSLGSLLWSLAFVALAISSLTRRLDVWVTVRVESAVERPHAVRLSHLAAVPGLAVCVAVPNPDVVTVAAGLSLIAAVAAQLLVLDGRNRSLWRSLRHQATTDELTGLRNRSSFLAELAGRLAVGPALVLFVDLDGFKAVNDTQGHAIGDDVLRRAGRLIASVAADQDVTARLGGDEFAILVGPAGGVGPARGVGSVVRGGPTGAADPAAGARLAERLTVALRADPVCRGVGASVGIVAGTAPNAAALLRDADLAMADAKRAGGGRNRVFEPAMRERVLERSRICSALELAFAIPAADPRPAQSRLELDLQPIVSLRDGHWAGFEALVRWRDHGVRRPPADFIPLAQEAGLIVPLGDWVLHEALLWLAGWPDGTAGVSVNVASAQVADPAFTVLVRDELERSGIDPGRLTLEVTEQTAVEDVVRAGAVLQSLRGLGVHVSLDDFGTGFSSLGYLARLPVDELKIDQTFVAGLGVREQDDALVRSVLRLAKDFGLRVVAEGVETTEQARALRLGGCPLAQGYLFARPTPAPSLLESATRSRDLTPGMILS